MLSEKDIRFILKLISDKYGFGYTDAIENGLNIGGLQAKLSILLEMAVKRKED